MSSQPTPDEPRLQVKIRRAAYMLDVDERTIRRMLARGELPSVGKGRMRRIRVEDLREWQRQNRQGGPDA